MRVSTHFVSLMSVLLLPFVVSCGEGTQSEVELTRAPSQDDGASPTETNLEASQSEEKMARFKQSLKTWRALKKQLAAESDFESATPVVAETKSAMTSAQAQALEDFYLSCADDVLGVASEANEVELELDERGLLKTCQRKSSRRETLVGSRF